MAKSYWLVGATWGDEDMYETFVRRGYWEMGYSDKEKPNYAGLRRQMKKGDLIAIKSMLGQGAPDIRIKAIGRIKEVDGEDGRVYVQWVYKAIINRTVPSKGCYGTIHGPFRNRDYDEWIGKVFRI
jgi:hypothetical protein